MMLHHQHENITNVYCLFYAMQHNGLLSHNTRTTYECGIVVCVVNSLNTIILQQNVSLTHSDAVRFMLTEQVNDHI